MNIGYVLMVAHKLKVQKKWMIIVIGNYVIYFVYLRYYTRLFGL